MEEKDLSSWEEFEEEVSSLIAKRDEKNSETPLHISNYLFRGHPDCSWELDTTLERYTEDKTSLKNYYRNIFAAKFQIETFTNTLWDLKTPPEFSKYMDEKTHLQFHDMPGYEYLIYMRHHGFPSPLLDWTRSPYIASYFAFSKAKYVEAVSVYAYQEYSGGGKSYTSRHPYVQALGPYVRSHERHFLQQSEYTICTVEDDGEYYYSSHEQFFRNNRDEQDLLIKFNIPITEKFKALKKLDSFNLNAFALFNNEESLMETMALRELYLSNKRL